MWSYITSIFHNFFKTQEDENREEILVEELIELKLQLESEEYNQNKQNYVQDIPQQSECFQRTGKKPLFYIKPQLFKLCASSC